jgi:hypothetical protein
MKKIRKDLYLYNESTGWLLTSVGLNGRVENPIEDGEDWDREFDRGTFIPMSLVQDDSLVVRVVVGDELKPQEEEEWIDRFEWKLAVPDGKLLLAASREYIDDPDFEQHDADSLRVVRVQPGEYRVEVYTMLPGVNGPYDKIGSEELPDYWRRTRGRARMPAWMDEDAEEEDDEDDAHLLDFLVRLIPLEAEPERPPLEDGWISVEVNPRKPERCPKGIRSRKVAGLSDREPYVQTDLNYVHRVPELVAELPFTPISGGPVKLPVTNLAQPYWIAWCCGETHPYVRISNCPDIPLPWPGFLNGIKETREEDGWRVDIEGMNARFTPFGYLRQVGSVLAGLPDGSVVELANADNTAVEDDEEEEDENPGQTPPGFQRFRGAVQGGIWQIAESYPAIDAVTLRAMLALAAELEAGGPVSVQNEAEAEAVLTDLNTHDFLLRQHPPKLRGNHLVLDKDHPELLPFLGARVFNRRFQGVWPMIERSEDLSAWDGMMDKIAQAGAAWATGDLVHEGALANFTQAPPLTETDAAPAEVVALDQALVQLGFQHLGDLHTTQTFSTVFRAYAPPGAECYAALFRTFLGRINLDFFNTFADGWSLTTSNGGGEMDTNETGYCYRHGAEGSAEELLALHQAEVGRLAARHGAPVPVVPTLEGFAEALDEFMSRTLGK